MKIIASRSGFRLAVGLLAYLAVLPMLLLLAGGYGGLIGFTLGQAIGFDSERCAELVGSVALFSAGPLLVLAIMGEAWARVFRQVRLDAEHLEFERFGSTIRWRLEELRGLRVTSQSTTVHYVNMTEVAVCLTGPDGRRLHLTDLNVDTAAELLNSASQQMGYGMARRLENKTLHFGRTLSSHLNIYSLGPPLLLLPILGSFGFFWVGLGLAVLYLGYMVWTARRAGVAVTATGLRRYDGTEVAWTDVTSAEANFDLVEIATTAGSWVVLGPENVLPLGALINEKVRAIGPAV